jgi:spoIIIJ-associated protein
MSQRFEGKSLEEALQLAGETLGVDRWQLTYHVLLEKRGFLGGIKRVIVEAEVNTAAAPPAAPAAAPAYASYDDRPSPPARAPRERDRGGRGGRGGVRGARGRGEGRGDSRGAGGGQGGGRGRAPRREESDLQLGDFERHFDAAAPEQGSESENAKSVREWIERVLELTRLELEVRTEENDVQVIVKLYGRDARRLTDRHGELLDAIQVLVNKSLGGRKIEKDIELDCAGFKESRLTDLGQRAKETADRVRVDGREELLPAMSPIERRIVHLALRDDAEVTTESRGDGFFKRVAIIRRTADSQPQNE